jgi:adenylate cyclase
VERHIELNPNDIRALYMGGSALMHLGQTLRGEGLVMRALSLDPDNPGTLYNVACFFSLSGKADKAIDCIERALKNGFAHKEWIEHDSDLDPVRKDARFQSLLERMK